MTTNGSADKGFQHVDGNHHVKNENGIMVGFLGDNELMINEVDENIRKNEPEQVVHPQISLVASVSMTTNGGADKGFQHVDGNHHVKNENGIVVGFPGDNELINEVDENVRKNELEQVVYPQVSMQVSQPQPQGSLVHWERFLHVQSIKVMLVENDDSTRQIVAALLRNCNYEVIEAVNGFQAWKILEDISNHIDIVLTEVVMPCLSGISLLCKIMSHKTRKNIPVIMMSSHDSVGLVFKCLSKGAVDFLVKPIRKNELKNLWQHVWRRCHSSSGSGSESGSHFQRSVNSKSSIKSDKGSEPSDSNVGDNDGNTGSGSDDVSGTQSSWTKQAVEGDRPQAAPPRDQTTEHAENVTKGGLAIGRPKIFEIPMSVVEVPLKLEGEKEKIIEELDPAHNRRNDKGLANCTGDHLSNKHKLVNINMCPEEHGESEDLGEPEKIMETNPKAIDDCKEVAVVEPSTKDAGRAIQKKLYALRQTTVAAFTRYNTTSNSFKASHRAVRSSSQPDNSLNFVKKESMHGVRAHSDGYLVYQNSNDIGNSIDVASSTNKLLTNHVIQKEKPEARFAVNCSQPSSSLQPIETDDTCSSLQGLLAKVGDITTTYGLDPSRDMHQDLPSVQHIHHHHHVHHYHDMDGQQPLSNHNDLSLKEFAADAPHYRSSSTAEVNPEKYSLDRSASGSKRGSNAQIRNSTAIDVGGTNVESDVGLACKSESGYASGSKTGNRIEKQKSAQKPAALTRCHRKRMEQCFQKKVRYQNRKRQSEQRPRARGKFVRQTDRDSSNDAAQG